VPRNHLKPRATASPGRERAHASHCQATSFQASYIIKQKGQETFLFAKMKNKYPVSACILRYQRIKFSKIEK